MKSVKTFGLVAVIVALFAVALPAAAQDATAIPSTPAMPGTITVFGSATVEGAPDQAQLELGVDVFTTDVTGAFSTANDTVAAIVAAIVELGIAEEDIQTANLNIYSTSRYNTENGTDENGYQVSNTVRILVRDIELVDDVINVGIANGATSLYGLTFSVNDAAPLETLARQEAIAQAQNRAAELAGLVGGTVGEVLSVSEDYGGGSPIIYDYARVQDAGGNAFVAPGQTSVSVGLTVTFALIK